MLLLILGACSTSREDCFGDPVSIDEGVYGRVVTGCELGGCRPDVGAMITLYARGPAGSPPPAGDVIGDDTVGDDGMYEIAAPAGDYDLCMAKRYGHLCTPVTLSSGEVRRHDVADVDLGRTEWRARDCK